MSDGLCLAGRADEARSVLRSALFRNPRSARVRALWAEFQFRQLRRKREEDSLGRAQPVRHQRFSGHLGHDLGALHGRRGGGAERRGRQ